MNWVVLTVAGLLETFWAYELKLSEGFSRLGPSVLTIVGMVASFALLSHALKSLPLGTAYAVWTGIGILGTTLVGIVVFKEPVTALKLICSSLVLVGIAGLNMVSH